MKQAGNEAVEERRRAIASMKRRKPRRAVESRGGEDEKR